jgi:hypothetical protein
MFVFAFFFVGCLEKQDSKDAISKPSPSSRAGHQVTSDANDSADDALQASRRTLDEVKAFLKPGMTSDQFQEFVKTTPILVNEHRFHWILKDGSMWTDVEPSSDGAVISNVVEQSDDYRGR